ncbi:MAG: MurT ligase domain-containing protein [Arcanobacterium sp.]|nr:MurT ligase domain-containing protein [Arcanobacterium sp.]MDY5589692.1 MurT ligase domain-containing protein [Arcanobacterium sp.]
MNSIRFFAALFVAKLAMLGLKITRHNGTQLPGVLAIKICPDFLGRIAHPEKILGVTGTNGKTTVVNLLNDALTTSGIRVLSNKMGSNLHTGVASALIMGTSIFNKSRYSVAVFELDERATPRIFPYLAPDLLVVTNLFRDSTKRNAHSGYIFWVIDQGLPASTKLLLNADDVVSSQLGEHNERRFFGIERMPSDVEHTHNIVNDGRTCPRCHLALTYEYMRYHHIGKAYCTHCGWHSPEYDYAGTNVRVGKGVLDVRDLDGTLTTLKILNDGVHNIYNVVTAFAALREFGFTSQQASSALAKISIVKSRFSQEKYGDVYVGNQLAKGLNGVASSRAFDYISHLPGDKELILMMSDLGDEAHYSENPTWLYDADFEYLANPSITHIVVTGPRGKDYRLRLLLAGVPDERITWVKREIDAPEQLHFVPGEHVFVLHEVDSPVLAGKVLAKTQELAKQKAAERASTPAPDSQGITYGASSPSTAERNNA